MLLLQYTTYLGSWTGKHKTFFSDSNWSPFCWADRSICFISYCSCERCRIFPQLVCPQEKKS